MVNKDGMVCPWCHGGEIIRNIGTPEEPEYVEETCPRCGGTTVLMREPVYNPRLGDYNKRAVDLAIQAVENAVSLSLHGLRQSFLDVYKREVGLDRNTSKDDVLSAIQESQTLLLPHILQDQIHDS